MSWRYQRRFGLNLCEQRTKSLLKSVLQNKDLTVERNKLFKLNTLKKEKKYVIFFKLSNVSFEQNFHKFYSYSRFQIEEKIDEIKAETQLIQLHRSCIPKSSTVDDFLAAYQERKKFKSHTLSKFINGLINFVREKAGAALTPTDPRLKFCGTLPGAYVSISVTKGRDNCLSLLRQFNNLL